MFDIHRVTASPSDLFWRSGVSVGPTSETRPYIYTMADLKTSCRKFAKIRWPGQQEFLFIFAWLLRTAPLPNLRARVLHAFHLCCAYRLPLFARSLRRRRRRRRRANDLLSRRALWFSSRGTPVFVWCWQPRG